MWCNKNNNNTKEVLEDLIAYFEGTCEFCLANMGIEQYLNDIEDMNKQIDSYDVSVKMLINYLHALILYKLDKLEKAFDKWKDAEKYANEIQNEEYIAKIYSYFSIYYYVSKDYNLEKIYLIQASEIFLRLKLYSNMALYYINILWYKRYEDDKEEVIKYLNNAFFYVKKSKSKFDARIYLHIGYIIKTIFCDILNGIPFLEISQDICHRNGNIEMESMTLHIIADSYLQLEKYDEAMQIYNNLIYCKNFDYITHNLQCMILSNYANLSLCMKNEVEVQNVLEILKDTMIYASSSMQQQINCVRYWLLSNFYFLRNNIDKALELINECKLLMNNIANNIYIEDFDIKELLLEYDIYSHTKDYDKRNEVCEKIEKSLDSKSLITKRNYYIKQIKTMENEKNNIQKKYYQELLKKNPIKETLLYNQLTSLYKAL